MYTLKKVFPLHTCMLRAFAAEAKVKPKFDFKLTENVAEKVKTGLLKPRHHPGVLRVGSVCIPDDLLQAATTALVDYPVENLIKDGKKLSSYINSRHPPLEKEEYKDKLAKVIEKVMQTETTDPMSPGLHEEERKRLLDSRRSKVHEKMKKETYNWRAIEYNEYNAALYAVARLAPDFASLIKILSEIKKRDPEFSPPTLLDFGSGVGSSMWAVDRTWPGACREAVCIDASADMNTLADKLLRGGNCKKPLRVRPGGTFFKQFLPTSDAHKYELVMCSRSLFELPDIASRLRTIDILWRKTGGYLIIIESGTNAGYRLVLEARDYVLELSRRAQEEGDPNLQGHVFSPCSHDMFCPRFFDGTNIPCNFEVSYKPFTFNKNANAKTDIFSYVVLKRGKRNEDVEQWPRVVQSPLKCKRHVICRTCTKYGTLKELTVTKRRHGKDCYSVCKRTSWGDLLPIVLPEPEPTNTLDSPTSLSENENCQLSR
ncbi:ribosome assembly protein METTL17, mitochondrial [Procambarus clarkii]|uniref:ribosome assembly protein METTL17, mitochondrial n=1 Tax=Procambarus clarkii TaxID=6728 RepID=UPI001E671F23|nr:methyltransferase-like protein 17, mitochondrial [Procambarus clarkii]